MLPPAWAVPVYEHGKPRHYTGRVKAYRPDLDDPVLLGIKPGGFSIERRKDYGWVSGAEPVILSHTLRKPWRGLPEFLR